MGKVGKMEGVTQRTPGEGDRRAALSGSQSSVLTLIGFIPSRQAPGGRMWAHTIPVCLHQPLHPGQLPL